MCWVWKEIEGDRGCVRKDKKELADMEQKYAQATQHCRDRERDLKI